VRQAMHHPTRVECLCAGALTESAVGQASIVRASRIPAKSVPEGYAKHTLSPSLTLSPRAHAHTKAYQRMHSSGSTTCKSAPLRRHTRQYTSNHFDFGQCTGMSSVLQTLPLSMNRSSNCNNYPERKIKTNINIKITSNLNPNFLKSQ
jgi:hypothetical protein